MGCRLFNSWALNYYLSLSWAVPARYWMGGGEEKEDEVGCVWEGGGEESGKAPNVGDAQVRDATSESVKGIILKKFGW